MVKVKELIKKLKKIKNQNADVIYMMGEYYHDVDIDEYVNYSYGEDGEGFVPIVLT